MVLNPDVGVWELASEEPNAKDQLLLNPDVVVWQVADARSLDAMNFVEWDAKHLQLPGLGRGALAVETDTLELQSGDAHFVGHSCSNDCGFCEVSNWFETVFLEC